jgi:hypothetical protein
MRVAVVDTYYPPFLATLPPVERYESGLRDALSRYFGTHSAYSRHLHDYGWESIDIIANHEALQRQWAKERVIGAASLKAIALAQIEEFKPDVVFLQDLSLFDPATLASLASHYLLAGQCSCPMPAPENVSKFHVLFTSFPHYVERFAALGVHAEYLPLAFDPIILERARVPQARTLVSFVGGYGRHWDMDEMLVALAERTPIQFWGYGYEKAPEAVRKLWMGEAWGLDMYEIYLRSHIVFNRHGGVAEGYANNLRMFEATGCGALLLTEYAPNLSAFFSDRECVTYTSPDEAVERINYYLMHQDEMQAIASAGQARTVTQHTYFQRIKRVSDVLKSRLKNSTSVEIALQPGQDAHQLVNDIIGYLRDEGLNRLPADH